MNEGFYKTLIDFIAEKLGLHFPPEKYKDLENIMKRASKELGFNEEEECARWFMEQGTLERLEIMAQHLTIGETYFNRDPETFEILKKTIIPERLSMSKRQIRVWSAGCASGEEAYSIAILLKQMGSILKKRDVMIMGTDINTKSLGKAQKGIYSEWSFRETALGFKEQYFKKNSDGKYELNQEVKEMVQFGYFNLVKEAYPSLTTNTNAMDIIFCRNVLMYFTKENCIRTIERLKACLCDGGWLIVSPCEVSEKLTQEFKAHYYKGAIAFQKIKENGFHAITIGVAAEMPQKQHTKIEIPPLIQEISKEIVPQHSVTELHFEEILKLFMEGHYDQARMCLESRIRNNGKTSKEVSLLSRVYANQGNLLQALSLTEEALEFDKLDPRLHYQKAVILQEQDMLEEAVKSLKTTLYLDQDMVLAHFSLGNLALRQGKTTESKGYFNNALELLGKYTAEETVPESGGILVGRLTKIIQETLELLP